MLCELITLEIEFRHRLGERPEPAEYVVQFPSHAPVVQALIRKLAAAPAPEQSTQVVKLSVVEGPHKGQHFDLSGHDTFLFGRSKHAHFQLPPADKYFSRIHFMVEANYPNCRLTDMGSHNGTYVNGKRVYSSLDLHEGDQIKAGHTVFSLTLSSAPGTAVKRRKRQ